MNVKIIWKAFGQKPEIGRFQTSVEFKVPQEYAQFISDEDMCHEIYKQTNTYAGSIWDVIQPKMAPTRTHTAISVGDEIIIDGREYTVADFGFIRTEDAVIKRVGSAVFSVVPKEEVGVRDVFQIDQDRMMTRMADAEMGDY